jgi:hypothetical protein
VRKSNLERLQEQKRKSPKALQLSSIDDLLSLLLGGPALPTQRDFIYSSDRLRAYKGPAGCAKTSTICALGWLRVLLVPGFRLFVSRNDYNDLLETTMGRMTEMLNRLPRGVLLDRDKSPPQKWWIRPVVMVDVDGNELDPSDDANISTITFMGLSDMIVGIEANGWIIDEMDEVEEKRVHEIQARLRAKGDPRDIFFAGAFNPPDKHHWLFTACTGRNYQDTIVQQPWLKLYEPKPKENEANLIEGYYDNLTKTLPEDQRQRFVDGIWGSVFNGKPVYPEFKRGWHVKRDLMQRRMDDRTLFRFWDFGYRHPVCLFAQVDFEGRLLMLKEIVGKDIEARAFGLRVQAQTAIWFPKHGGPDIVDYGDPAVTQKKDTGSTLLALRQIGISMLYRTSKIEQGVNLGRRLLGQTADGEPLLQFDQNGVPTLISALSGGYRFADRPEDDGLTKPLKDGFYEHPADAWRYGILNIFGPGLMSAGGRSATTTIGSLELPKNLSYDPNFDPMPQGPFDR